MTIQKINRAKLTKRLVESSEPDSSKRTLIWDTEITGFCVRVYPTGRKTYFFQYRNVRKETKFLKIGVHGNVTAEFAREQAKLLALKVSTGEDPSIKQPEKAASSTIETLADKYLEHHAEIKKRPKSIKEDKYMLKNYILKEFGALKVDQISFEEIQKLHTSLNKKRVLSNRILSLLHKMFNLAIQWKWRPDNPVSGIEKYQEHKRTRWLQEDELRRLLAVLDATPSQTVPTIIRLLLLTGARKHEVLEATWDQFDLDKGVWTKRALDKKSSHHQTKENGTFSPIPGSSGYIEKTRRRKERLAFFISRKSEGNPASRYQKVLGDHL